MSTPRTFFFPRVGTRRLATAGLVAALWWVAPAVRAATGGELFAKNCALCHGADGKARTPIAKKLGVKDLTVSKLADDAIERQILDGRKNDRGAVLMPPFREKLSPEEIQAIVAFVKALRV